MIIEVHCAGTSHKIGHNGVTKIDQAGYSPQGKHVIDCFSIHTSGTITMIPVHRVDWWVTKKQKGKK